MLKIAAEFQGTSYFISSIGGAVRWAVPKLYYIYEDHTSPVATSSDVYSYGSLTLPVLTGQVPYHYIKSYLQVVFELHKGLPPRHPIDETSGLEDICQHLDTTPTSARGEVTQRLYITNETFIARSRLKDELKDRASIWSGVMNSEAEKQESAELPENITPGSNRLSTAMRPCTAPVLYTPARSSHYVGPQAISRTSTSGSGMTVSITYPDELSAP
ncbi:hypothetical protein PILCRDRAFT_12657 [Piloderma croceum F 1598]|uniref:Protein kinase domain-containing protein n=1 Tax=Piloderma croceum (strain F 1598) TaxID=765440 RepID=A0A0C3FA79_PILCF|nr:hypothetical protein PILCRDRAFT_12657 [Piloderma croceum F 1598]